MLYFITLLSTIEVIKLILMSTKCDDHNNIKKTPGMTTHVSPTTLPLVLRLNGITKEALLHKQSLITMF